MYDTILVLIIFFSSGIQRISSHQDQGCMLEFFASHDDQNIGKLVENCDILRLTIH